MVQVSSGQRQLTDLNDSKALQLFLSSSQSNTQIYNQTTGGYSPDWTSAKPVVTPELYAPGTNTNILSQAKSITWFDEGTQISSGTNYTLGSGNQTLTINTNRVIAIDDALSFDSSTTAVTTPTLFASAPSALTVMVKFRMVATPSSYTTIADFGTPATGAGAIYIEGVQGVNQLLFGAAVTSGGNAFSGATNEGRSGGLTINQFHVATMVLTASSMLVYVDGSLATTVAGTYDLSKAVHALTIGAGRAYFNGDIAYVGVFNTAVQPEFVSQYSTNGLKGNEPGLVNYYNLVTASGTTVTDSVGAKNATISGTFTLPSAATLHKKTVMCQVVYTDPAVQTDLNVTATIDITRLYTGTVGNQGAPVAMAYLNNDSSVVATNNDGTGGTYGAPNTQSTMTIMLGGTDVTSLYTFSQTKTNVTVTEPTTSNVATITAMSADTGSVTFTATRSGYPTLTKTFYLAKSKMGVVGQNPTDWWLNVSSGTIATADDGSYTPSTITISAESQVGTGTPAAYAGRFIIAESADGNTFTNKYTSSSDESSHAYSPSSGLKAIKVTLYQAGGTSVKLDEQNIMVIGNGKNSVMVSAWTPTGNVIRNAANTVTAEADLLNGGQPVTGTNYRWVKGNGAATSVIAGAGYEDLDLGKRNLLFNTDFHKAPQIWNSATYTINTGTPNSIVVTKLSGNSNFGVYTDYKTNITAGTSYTLSFEAKTTDITSFNYNYVMDNDEGNYNISAINSIPDGEWHYYTLTFSASATRTNAAIMIGYTGSGTQFEIRKMKLELGSNATPWGIAYEEVAIDVTDNTLYGNNIFKDSNYAKETSGTAIGLSSWGGNVGTASYDTDIPTGMTGLSEKVVITTVGTGGSFHDTDSFTIVAGQTYTISFYAKADATITRNYYLCCLNRGTDNNYITGGPSGSNGNGTGYPLTTSWQRFYFTFTATASQAGAYKRRTICYDVGTAWLADFKLELGSYMSDWTPALADNSTLYPNGTAGVNNWVYRNYTDGSNATRKIYGYSDFPSLTPVYQTLIADGASLRYGDYGSYFVGYYKTAVYVSTAKTINYQFAQDDTINILVNGLQQGSQINTETTAQTYPLSLQAGWNTIELILQEIQGNDGIELSNTLSTLVEEMNCNYALDFGSAKGNYGLMGYNTSSMIVDTNAVTDTDLFECLVTYRGAVYKDSVTINDVTDPITMIINGSKLFKNNQGTNTYTAQLYQNGAEIDAGGTQYTYTWYVYNSDGSLDATFGGSGSKTGKTITLASSDINVKGKLQCQVSM